MSTRPVQFPWDAKVMRLPLRRGRGRLIAGLLHLVVQFAVLGAFGAKAHTEAGSTREALNIPVGETSSDGNFYGGWLIPQWGPATGLERAQVKPLVSINGCPWTEIHPVSPADVECDAHSVVPEVRGSAHTPDRRGVDDRQLVNSKLLSHCLELLIVDPYPRPSDDRGDQCQKLRQEIRELPVSVRLIYLLATTYWSSVIVLSFWRRVCRRSWTLRTYWVGFGEFLAWGIVFFHGLSVFYG